MGHVSRRRGVPSPRCAAPRRKNFERAEIGLAKCSRLADAPHVRRSIAFDNFPESRNPKGRKDRPDRSLERSRSD
jgi:hypothetical protein